ncbi:hypothetical protein [Alienimonas chondri]|uniref:Uncharacterized protein n=1 Tax=Alienimonas chondri TaxID=2681879 RepID=A0ABX1VML3_9PLAN|nr:hypothetical protein [Alienimonas chondri]NNJ27721.1 hypothetical protein [Alienimonas chondri]
MATSPAALLIVAAAWLAPAPAAVPVEQAAEALAVRPPAPSLADVFPESVPAAIDAFAFAPLGERWSDWGAATAKTATILYLPDAPATRQREAIRTLRGAVAQLDAAAADPRFSAIRPALRDLRGPLERRALLAEAALDARAAAESVSIETARRGANERLSDAMAALRAELATIPGGDRWLQVARADRLDAIAAGQTGPSVHRTLSALVHDLADPTIYAPEQAAFLARPEWRRLASIADVRLALVTYSGDDARPADGATVAIRQFVAAFERFESDATDEAARALAGAAADLAAVAPRAGEALLDLIDDLYDGDNVRIAIGEDFLRRFIAQTRKERGAISQVMFGARVRGVQETDVDVDVDVVPEVGAARFDVVLRGLATTETVSRTRQARVETTGRHRFEARKTLVYDGTRFRNGRTTVDVDPFLRNTRINTIYDDVAGGLLRDVIQREAFAEAGRRQPAALARAERELESNLRPQLDRQLTEQFDVVNLRAGGALRRRATNLGLAPSRESISSTEREMRIFVRLSDQDELAGTPAPRRPIAEDGVVAQVHQSAMNNSADRLNLAGRTVTPDELGVIVTEFAGELFGRDIAPLTPSEPSVGEEPPPTLTFAASDPIRVCFEANRLVLIVRVGLAAPANEDGTSGEDVPPQRVSIPFDVTLTETGEVVLTRGGLSVAPLGRPESRFRQQAIGRVLRSRLGDAIPEESVVPARTVVATDARTRIKLRLASLELADGWATAVLR